MTHAEEEARPGQGGSCHIDSNTAVPITLDPVCGMTVDPAKTSHHARDRGADYYFCSAGCLAKFTGDPAKYLSDTAPIEPAAAPGEIRMCPMHAQVPHQGPGTCPICGMALEPEEPSLSEAPNPEPVDFTWRCGLGPASGNICERERLNEATVRRRTGMRDEIGLEKARCRVVPLVRMCGSGLPP